MRSLVWFALFCAACSSTKPGVHFDSNCVAGTPTDEAKLAAGKQSDGSVLLPGGRRLTPAGRLLTIGGFPLILRVLPAAAGGVERYAVVTDGGYGDEYLRLVDLQAPGDPVIAKVDYPAAGGGAQAPALFYGLALKKDGSKIYVSDGTFDGAPANEPDQSKHFNVIEAYSLVGTGLPPALTRVDAETIHLPFANGKPRWPAGLALSPDEKTLYSVNQNDGTLSAIDLASGVEVGRTPPIGSVPYDLALDETGATAYVSLWGGKPTGTLMWTEGVVPIALAPANAPMPMGAAILTGKAAEQMVWAGGKLFVASSDGDAIAAIDPASSTVTATAHSALDTSGLWGSAPNALAVDATANRLYVANAGEDAVQAFDLATLTSLGRIPTAWYPTAVAVLSDGTVVIASGKGLGAGPMDERATGGYFAGTLQVVPRPSASDLMMGDAQVHANLTRPSSIEVPLTCTGSPRTFPLPADRGGPTPIEHVFLVVRENKTYDSLLGDLASANGEPSLVLFGENNTPNLHALAKQFVVFDNFYSNAEQSLQGHDWTTAAAVNDYGEKVWLTTWGRGTRPAVAFGNSGSGLDHLSTPGSKPIWQALDAAGVTYHNYGEVVNSSGAKTQLDVNYPGLIFALGIPDVEKIGYVNSNITDPTFQLEPLSYIGLPNDHTYGTSPGMPTPQSMVADNDEATGRLIDAISHSPYWPTTAIFVIEDDPSDGGDHVEMHRSPAILVSPWARRAYTSSVHYDNPSLWKTITLLLKVGSLNLYDENAAAMYDAFATTPDFTPYTFIPSNIPPATNTADAPLASESAAIDWSRPDTAPLDRILWKAVHGKDAEPPWNVSIRRLERDDDD